MLVYIRVSKIGNRQDTLISDEIQEDVCSKWAEREGLTIVGEPITDLDKTGREMTKRQIRSSIERVRRGEADGIVVWKISRWGRNLVDAMLNVHELQEAGGFIASATENLDDIETPMGQFSLTQMLAIAQLQSDQIGETWRDIIDYRLDRGLPGSGKDRFGYVKNAIGRDDNPALAYVEHPFQGPWLRSAYEAVVAGRPLMSVVKQFRENEVLTNNGKLMTYSSLRKIMDSGFAAGLLVYRTKEERKTARGKRVSNPNSRVFVVGKQTPLISRELWDAYVQVRAERRPPREAAPVHRLAGLVHCGVCGRKLVAVTERRSGPEPYRQSRCVYSRHRATTASPCPAPVVMRQSYVEEQVFEWIGALSRNEGDYDQLIEQQRSYERAMADIAAMEQEIRTLSEKRDRFLVSKVMAVNAAEVADMDRLRAQFGSAIEDLEFKIKRLQAQPTRGDVPDVQLFGLSLDVGALVFE